MTNVSAVTKHFPSAEEGFTTTLSSTISAGATTVGVNSLSGYTTGEVATFVVAPTVASEKQVFTGVVDTAGLQLTNVVWTTGTNQTHAAGTTVVDYATATHISQMSKGILAEHNQDGSHGAVTATSVASSGAVSGTTGTFSSDVTEKGSTLTTIRNEHTADFVASGGVWSGDSYGSTRNASMTALVCYINGQRGTISAVTARSFTASKDTYIDVLNNSGTFSLVYTEVTNNAASPALAANSLRLGIVVTGASNIASSASINQGAFSATLPTTTNTNGRGRDSLGNYIYNTSPLVDTRLERHTLASATGNGTTLGTGRYFYIGDMLIQTGSGYVNNGFTGWTNVGVTFAKAFSELPIVTITPTSPVGDTEAENGYPMALRALATSSFQIRVYHGNSTLGAGYNWIAIGKA